MCFRYDIVFRHSSHSSLANHVHRFNAVERSLRTLKRAVAFGQPHAFFRVPVVLLDSLNTGSSALLILLANSAKYLRNRILPGEIVTK